MQFMQAQSRWARAGLVGVLALGVSACAVPEETLRTVEVVSAYSDVSEDGAAAPAPDGQPGVATVVIFRDNPLGLALSPILRINDQEIGRCAYGRRTVVQIPSGTHQLSSFSESENTRTFVIAAGETAYVRCSLLTGFMAPNAHLDFVRAEEGRQASARMNTITVSLLGE